jgi:hypothetical protein
VAPVVYGNGQLYARGGNGGSCCGWTDYGSGGRIRIDCTDDYNYRSLGISGSFSRGSQMWVFQTNAPQLDITFAAGQSIPIGITNAVYVSLPFGAPTNQQVALAARNFTNDVLIRIAVTPDTGPSLSFDGLVPNTGNPSTNTFNVVIPAGTVSRIDAWTR